MGVDKLVAKENEAGAREKLIETASQIMREGDTIDISACSRRFSSATWIISWSRSAC
jgi:hypothetical protein